MNKLSKSISEYIAMRRRLGYKLKDAAHVLHRLAIFMSKKNKSTIKTRLVLDFIAQENSCCKKWIAEKIGFIRHFAIYQHAVDPKTEIPPACLLRHNYVRRRPYIFSKNEVIRLLSAARDLVDKYQFGDTAYIFFGLIAVTGMRTCEALALNDESIDLSNGTIKILNAKFKKSRTLPLHASTIEILKKYVKSRNKRYPIRMDSAFFLNCRGGRPSRQLVQKTFRKICVEADLFTEGRSDYRIMDLRHSFAVTNLLRCYQEDLDVDQTVAFLSIYLGHENPENTYWYLTSTPELLNLINQRTDWRK